MSGWTSFSVHGVAHANTGGIRAPGGPEPYEVASLSLEVTVGDVPPVVAAALRRTKRALVLFAEEVEAEVGETHGLGVGLAARITPAGRVDLLVQDDHPDGLEDLAKHIVQISEAGWTVVQEWRKEIERRDVLGPGGEDASGT